MRAIRAEQVRALHARLAGILTGEGIMLAVRLDDGVVRVTARAGEQQVRLESDLLDPDAELVLAAKLACFVERAKHAP
jgi:hypothetical protein